MDTVLYRPQAMRLLELQPTSNLRRRTYTDARLFQIVCFLRSPEPWADQENTYIRLLQSCATLKALKEGKQVHSHMVKHGLKPNGHTWSLLIAMYANCGCFLEAQHALRSMTYKTVDAWTSLIAAYTCQGHHDQALHMFYNMVQERISVNEATILCALDACADLVALNDGLQIHDYIVTNGHGTSLMVQNSIVKMYCKCHGLELAEKVFAGMEQRNGTSWTALIVGYVDHKLDDRAIITYQRMLEERFIPNKAAFVHTLKACANLGILDLGKDIHQHIRSTGLGSDALLNNMLIIMYSRCGSIQEARKVFNRMSRKDITSWNAMLGAYTRHSLYKHALKMFDRLKRDVIKPDKVTITIMLDVCTNLPDLGRGKEVHHYFIRKNVKANVSLLNSVLVMYIKCGAIEEARQFFDGLRRKDITIFNTMIAGYVQFERGEEARELFQLMRERGVRADKSTFESLHDVCNSISLERGESQTSVGN